MPGVSTVDDGSIYIQSSSPVANINDDFVPMIDVSRWKWINVGIGNASYNALLVPQWSNDNVTWENLKMYPITTLDAGDVSSSGTSAGNIVIGTFVSFQYFRVRALSYTSGSPTGFLQLLKEGLSGFQLQYAYMRAQYGHIIRNSSGIVLASGLVSGDGHVDLTNLNARGVRLYITPGTLGSGASNIVVTIQELDLASGNVSDLLASTALAASTPQVLKLYPGLPNTANVSINDFLPVAWRIKWAATNWGSGGSTLGISCALNE